uniref:Coiled-coil domain containing 138 n=1 Tax=Paramormyrops kingsleyae TaxID=1676925 RepID=A0A3B3QCU9_9TELE
MRNDDMEYSKLKCLISFFDTDVTLPSNLARISNSCVMKAAAPSGGRALEVCSSQMKSTSPNISQVYQEMLEIYEKLQVGGPSYLYSLTAGQAPILVSPPDLCILICVAYLLTVITSNMCLAKNKNTYYWSGIFFLLQYQQKIRELKEALEEKTKESKRMKSSLEAVKEMNEALKKQLSDVSEQSKKMEIKSRKVQARLENLQVRVISHHCHLLSAFTLLTLIYFHQAARLALLSPAAETDPPVCLMGPLQVLPLLAEQLQTLPVDDLALHMSLLRFIYWSLRQLDGPPQNTLTSTFRRLGEEVYRGTVLQGVSLDLDPPQRTKSPFFYKSPSRHARFLSTLILLKTVTQADILAQALGTLHEDVRHDDGRALFLLYRALPVISSHLKAGSRTLLSLALDVLQQMSLEPHFYCNVFISCSTEDFFRSVSLLLRSPRLEVTVVEKVSVLLQKLSKMRKNRRLFELFTIHLKLQEMQRTTDPTHSFLVINLSSILFNLGMLKKAHVCDGQGAVD